MKYKPNPAQELIKKIDQLEKSWHETEDEEERDKIWDTVSKLEKDLAKICKEININKL